MSSIDKRIVQMQFDNGQFEKGVSTTMNSLNNLKSNLSTLNDAGQTKKLQGALDAVTSKFSVLGTMADQTIRQITSGILNLTENVLKKFTIQPIIDGMATYEQKINSTQQIMHAANLTQKETLGYLNDLNEYSDKTIYSFSDMTASLGKFTAAGVDVNKATTAIKGLGNVAALSGASTQDFSRAIYNVSQALGSGYMLARDWMSIENANMATKEFKDTLKDTAVAMGYLTEEESKSIGNDLRGSLEKKWLNSEVLIAALNKYADAESEIGKAGYEAATKVKTFHQLMENMGDATATAWSRVFSDIVGQYEDAAIVWTAISNKLESIFITPVDNIHNALAKATADFNFRPNLIYGLADAFKALEAILHPIGQAFKSVFPIDLVKVFGNLGKSVRDMGSHMLSFWTVSYKGQEILEKLRQVFLGLFKAVRIVGVTFKNIVYILSPVGQLLKDLAGWILDILAPLGLVVSRADYAYEHSKKVASGVETLHNVIQGLVDILEAVIGPLVKFVSTLISGGGIEAAFDNMGQSFEKFTSKGSGVAKFLSGIGKAFSKLSELIDKVAGTIGDALTNLFHKNDQAADASTKKINNFGDTVKNVFTKVKDFFSNFATNFQAAMGKVSDFLKSMSPEQLGILADSAVFAGIGLSLNSLFNTIKKMLKGGGENPFQKLIDSLKGFADAIPEVITSTLDKIKSAVDAWKKSKIAETLKTIAESMLILAGALAVIAMIPAEKLASSTAAIAGLMAEMAVILKFMNSGALVEITGDKKMINNLGSMGTMLIKISAAILILSIAVAKLAKLDMGSMWSAVAAISGLLWELVGVTKVFGTMGDAKIPKVAAALIAMALALQGISLAIALLSKLDPGKMWSALAGISALLWELTGAMKVLATNSGNSAGVLSSALAIDMVAGALVALSIPLAVLSLIPFEKLMKSFAVLSLTLAALVAALEVVSKTGGGGAKSIAAAGTIMMLALALQMIAMPLAMLAVIPIANMATAMLGLIGTLYSLVGAMAILTKFSTGDTTKAVDALGLLVMSLGGISMSLAMLAKFDFGSLMASVLALNGTLYALVGALAILSLIPGGSAMAGAAAIMMLAVALQIMAIPLAALAMIPFGQLMSSMGALLLTLAGLVAICAIIGAGIAVILPGAAVLVGILAGLAAVFAIICAAAGALATAILTAGDGFVKLAAGIAALAAVGPMAESAFAVLKGAVEAFLEAIMMMIPMFFAKLALGLLSFLETILSILPKLLDIVGKILVQVFEAIKEHLPKIVELVLDTLSQILDKLKEYIPKMADTALDLLVAILDTIADHIQDIVEAGADIVVNLINGIANKLPDIIDAAINLIVSFIEGLAQGIENNKDRIKKAIDDLCQAIIDAFKTFFGIHSPSTVMNTQGNYLIDGLRNGIRDKLTDAGNAIADVGRKILDGFKGLPSKLSDIGKNIMTGLKNGISSMIDSVKSAVGTVATGVKDKFKKLLDIHSPSKVFAEYGRYIDLGLANGIRGNGKVVNHSLQGMTDSALSTMNDVIGAIGTGDFNHPVIAPIVDLSNVNAASQSLASAFSDQSMGVNAVANISGVDNALGLMKSLQAANADNAANAQASNDSIISAMSNEIQSLRAELADMTAAMKQMKIVMDTGTLVGAIAPEVDTALGSRAKLVGRGV